MIIVTNLRLPIDMNLKIATPSEDIAFRDMNIQPIKHQEIYQQKSILLDIFEDDIAAISNSENRCGNLFCPVSGYIYP